MKNIFDKNVENYSAKINSSLNKFGVEHEFFFRYKAWLLKEILENVSIEPANSRLLDVGCGIGILHSFIESDFARIEGIDVSRDSISFAAKEHKHHVYETYNGKEIPRDDASYDVCIAFAVFHHVEPSTWLQLATEMLRVTRKNGLCLLIEHNPFNPVTRYIVGSCDLDADATLITPRKLRSIFKEAGGQRVSTRSIFTIPPITHLLKRIDLKIGFANLGAQYYLTATR